MGPIDTSDLDAATLELRRNCNAATRRFLRLITEREMGETSRETMASRIDIACDLDEEDHLISAGATPSQLFERDRARRAAEQEAADESEAEDDDPDEPDAQATAVIKGDDA